MPDPQRQLNVPIREHLDRARSAKAARSSTPGPHPYARREQDLGVWQPSQTDVLKAKGLSVEGAPSEVRSLASYTLSGSHTPDTLRTALERHYGEPVNVRQREDRLEFRDPESGRWTVYNPPGMDWGDAASFEGEAYPTLGSVGGAVAGGAAGSLAGPAGTAAGAFGGDFAGSMMGEFARLQRGRELGMVPRDMSDEDLAAEAATTAAIGSGIALGTAGLGKLVTNAISRTGLEADPDEVMRLVNEKMQQHRSVGTEPTSGQLLEGTPTGERLLQEQERIIRQPNPPGDELRRRQFENVQRVASEVDRALAPATGETTVPGIDRYIRRQAARREDVGESIQELARERTAGPLGQQQERLDELQQSILNSLDEVGEGVDPQSVGGDVRSSLRDALDRFREEAQQAYGNVEQLMGTSARVSPDSVLKLARERKRLLQSDVYESLAPEDKQLLDETLKLAGKSGQGPRQIDYSTADRAVKALRRLERESRRGIKPAPELRLVRDLKQEWENVRRQIASSVPGGLEALEQADAMYRQNVERLYNSVVGELLDTRPGSFQFDVPDERVFEKIFRPRRPDRAREVFAIVDGHYPSAKAKIRDAVVSEWRRRVMRDDGSVNPTAHSRFMRDYGETAQLYLTPEQRRAMTNAEQFQRQLRREEQNLKELERRIKGTLDERIVNLEDPGEVLQRTWTRGRPQRAVKLKSMLEEDGVGERLVPRYRSAIKSRIFRQATSERQGVRQIDGDKLGGLVEEMRPALDTWFGRGTSDRLQEVAEAVRDLEARPLQQRQPAGPATAVTDITRGYVGQFTLPGRMLTAAKRIMGRQGDAMMSKLLLNPDYLAEMQRRQRRLRGLPTGLGIGASTISLPSLSETELNRRNLGERRLGPRRQNGSNQGTQQPAR